MKFLAFRLVSLAHFYLSATAQNSNNTVPNTCPWWIQRNQPDSPVNSTGRAVFPFAINYFNGNGEWSVVMTFNDSGHRSTPYVHFSNPISGYLQAYLNLPKDASGTACVYMLYGRNASSLGGGIETSCDGVLSEECKAAIAKMPTTSPAGECASISRETLDACEDPGSAAIASLTFKPIDLDNRTCDYSSIPGNVSVPEHSRTLAIMGRTSNPMRTTEQGMSDYTYYDQAVRQPVPVVVTVQRPNFLNAHAVVCVTPSNVVAGSRVPEGPWPPLPAAGGPNNGANNDTGSASGVKIPGLVALFLAVVFVSLL